MRTKYLRATELICPETLDDMLMPRPVLEVEVIPALKAIIPFELVMSKVLRTNMVDFVAVAAIFSAKGTE